MIDTKLIRQKILDLAIRGKLVPQDPSDEPASELLKRIHAEKAAFVKSGKLKKEKPLPPISKDEIPFDIPDSWEWVRLKSIAASCLGKMLDAQKNKGKLMPYLRNVNVRWHSFDLSDVLQMRFEEDELDRYGVMPGDLIVCEGGEPGRCAVWTETMGEMRIQKALHRVRPFQGISSLYLAYVIQYYSNNSFLSVFFTGSTIKHLTGKALEKLPFPLPPLAEQERIVAKVEALMNEVDMIERETENLNKTFSLTREKVLDLAIRGKLVPQDPTDEPASELLKRIHAEKAALIKSGKLKKEKPLPPISEDEIPFDIPASWQWVRLASLGSVIGGGTPSTSVPEYWDGIIPWLSPCDLSDYNGKYIGRGKRNISQEGLDHSSAALMPTGSILYSSRAPIGYVVIASNEISTNQGFKSLVPAIDGISEFIYYALKALTPDIRNRATGTTFKEISGSEFGKTLLPLPPLAEQKRIVSKLESILSTLDVQQKTCYATVSAPFSRQEKHTENGRIVGADHLPD